MPKKHNIRPTKTPRKTPIPTTPIKEKHVSFSFKHLDLSNNKFSISGKNAQYFYKVLERLKNLSELLPGEIQQNRSNALRAHPIEWKQTSERKGFTTLNTQLQGQKPYQFQVSANEHGRIHGFFIGPVFHVVWLDPDHKLYS
ncbi:MAG: hypothetical protein ACR2PX_01065 [Endozoicomonas sp.]|uniref:hypothetical protein n=1 Tax=Endozoicomonas sp. TaxID=1892382 RepID=UPI003D9BB92D